MKRWILALVMLGLSVVPALAETAVTTGMGYKKCFPNSARCTSKSPANS